MTDNQHRQQHRLHLERTSEVNSEPADAINNGSTNARYLVDFGQNIAGVVRIRAPGDPVLVLVLEKIGYDMIDTTRMLLDYMYVRRKLTSV